MTPLPTDVDELLVRIHTASARRGYAVERLGRVGCDPILFLHPSKARPGPFLLFAGGFHGDEPAGPWGILQYLESSASLDGVNVSFLPLVNPEGTRAGRHENDLGENPNRGFGHSDTDGLPPSKEGRILLGAINVIRPWTRDCFVSLHEDSGADRFYLFTFEKSEMPGEFTKMLVGVESSYFSQMKDRDLVNDRGSDGVIFNDHDGSFEDYLFKDGVPLTACTETPAQLAFEPRVSANVSIIKAVVGFVTRSLKP